MRSRRAFEEVMFTLTCHFENNLLKLVVTNPDILGDAEAFGGPAGAVQNARHDEID